MSRADLFATALQHEFHRRSALVSFGEIALFRVLKDAFGSLKPRFQTEEYHGAKRQVHFDTSQPWLRAPSTV